MPALEDVAASPAEGLVCAGHSGGERGEEGTLAASCGRSWDGFGDQLLLGAASSRRRESLEERRGKQHSDVGPETKSREKE